MDSKFCSAVASAVAIFLTACVAVPTDLSTRDDAGPGAEVSGPSLPYILQAFHCRVDLARPSPLQCTPEGGSECGAPIVGDHGAYVTLNSENWSSPGPDDILTLPDVTIENHMIQKLGTANGQDPHADGVRVFFQQSPNNGVDVLATGMGVFLQEGQPYFQYGGIIAPGGGVSDELDWQFDLKGQDHFEFGVLVAAPIPQEDGALLMVTRDLHQNTVWTDVWAVSEERAFAVGPAGSVAGYNATNDESTSIPVSTSGTVNAVSASDTSNIWIVGDNGLILQWDGTAWT
ncbi:MAG TPA: hypothetical protein VNZ55_11570 [Thermomicrobiales bacterium]|nr:hypothetical protein [Thermomicrobiales bacterium]